VDDLGTVTFDLETLTMGEASEAERQSGQPLSSLLRSPISRRMLGMFVHALRHYETPLTWSDLSNLRLLDVSQSSSRAPSGSPSAK
jgi:hypothetical protein